MESSEQVSDRADLKGNTLAILGGEGTRVELRRQVNKVVTVGR